DSRLEGTEIKLSTLPTAGHNGVAGDPNAGLDRHKAAHAEFAGAGGGHPSSTCRVRHCWLANVDLTPALFRHNHIMPWIAIDDTDSLYDPRARPRGHGCAINYGPWRAGFSAFHYEATLAGQAAGPAW